MRPLKALALVGCAGLLVAAVVAVVPGTLPNLWTGMKERPESPVLVTACWMAATTASITGKTTLAGGALTWKATSAAHIAGTVSNRVIPAGFGAGGAYLIALRNGGMALPAASAMVVLWAAASGVTHAVGALIGGLWTYSGAGVLGVVAVLPLVIWLVCRRRSGAAPRRRGPRVTGTARTSRDGYGHSYTAGTDASGDGRRARATAALRRHITAVRRSVGEAVAIIRDRPRLALAAIAAQATAMICLAIGFLIAAGGFGVSLPVTSVLAVYVAATALSAALPTPAGIGSAETALVGGLVMAGAPLSGALPAVLVFRSVILLAPIAAAVIMAVGWAGISRSRRGSRSGEHGGTPVHERSGVSLPAVVADT